MSMPVKTVDELSPTVQSSANCIAGITADGKFDTTVDLPDKSDWKKTTCE